jgi:hypothetical protein
MCRVKVFYISYLHRKGSEFVPKRDAGNITNFCRGFDCVAGAGLVISLGASQRIHVGVGMDSVSVSAFLVVAEVWVPMVLVVIYEV